MCPTFVGPCEMADGVPAVSTAQERLGKFRRSEQNGFSRQAKIEVAVAHMFFPVHAP